MFPSIRGCVLQYVPMDAQGGEQSIDMNSKWVLPGIIGGLLALLVLQTFLPAFAVLFGLVAVGVLFLTFARPLWAVAVLAIYFPFESFVLKFIPEELYIYTRFFSEGLIYVLVAVVLFRILVGRTELRSSPIDLPFALFLIIISASAVINTVAPLDAVLGIRQIIRFILVFFVIYYLQPSLDYIKRLTWVMFIIVIFQSILGIAQAIIGQPLDALLLPTNEVTLQNITITSGVTQFWDPGSRVFATLGRYDRLGNFLYIFLLIGSGLFYERYIHKHKHELLWLFALGLPALLFTFSRSSWFAFLLGFLFIALWAYRDKRVLVGFLTFVIVAASYTGLAGMNVRFMAEAPGQNVVERFYEAFSYTRWRGEYYGLGRLYWIVQTPTTVIPSSPLFGLGPSMYGGGAVAALGNTEAYDELGLPFGVYGTEGYIDNNWFALWGESGTLGMVFYAWMYIALFVLSIRLYRHSQQPFKRALAIGFAAVMLAIAFNAMTSTLLEIRTSAFYLWLYAGFIAVLAERQGLLYASEPQSV